MPPATRTAYAPAAVVLDNPRLHLPASTGPPSDEDPPTPKVWLIFGATGHIGRSLTKCALGHGDQVAAVGSLLENTKEQMEGWHERCLGLLCDVRLRETVGAVIKACVDKWGRLDIVVNCTGYGVIGSCEDQSESDVRSQFETNFLGTLNIIQLSLPYFREQSSKRTDPDATAGRYIIFSSTSGALGVPGLGPYCATKYAVEGLVESMLYEVDTFGIKASLVQPGHMRLDEPTGLHDDIFQHSDNSVKLRKYGHFLLKPPSAPYDTATSPAGHARRVVQWLTDRQPVSAVKSAELTWQLGHCKYPPLRLLLGSVAIDSVRDRLRSVIEEIEDWKHLHFPEELDEQGGNREDDDILDDIMMDDDGAD